LLLGGGSGGDGVLYRREQERYSESFFPKVISIPVLRMACGFYHLILFSNQRRGIVDRSIVWGVLMDWLMTSSVSVTWSP
jgi:hypothetical protein